MNMKTQIKDAWKLAWRLGIVLFIFLLFFIANDWGVTFGTHFEFKTAPKSYNTPANPAIEAKGEWLTAEF